MTRGRLVTMANGRKVREGEELRQATEAILLAGGVGSRLGGTLPKGLVLICGVPMAVWAARALLESRVFLSVIPILPANFRPQASSVEALLSTTGCRPAVSGGKERQDSMHRGLMTLKSSTKWVAIHDAARPLVDPADVSRVVGAAQRDGAAILGVQSVDTIKKVASERVLATQPRSSSFLAQTPQVFRREILLEAWKKAERDNFFGTDDAHLVERLGVPVTVVTAKTSNRKITYKEDLVWAEAVLRWRQNGGKL